MLVGYVRVSADVDTAGVGTRESHRPTMFGPQNNTCRKPLTKGKARRSECRKSPTPRTAKRPRLWVVARPLLRSIINARSGNNLRVELHETDL
jgi:hypothetical protein